MDQTLSAGLLLTIPLAPLAGSLIAGLLGTAFGNNLIGRRASHTAAIGGVFISFLISMLVLRAVVTHGASFDQTIYQWMQVGSIKMEVGFLIDSLTAVMMAVVTFVSLMVHIYTIGYMDDDPGYNRFFSYIALFTFSMLMLVMANNFMQLFVGWELVGLVSYLLIGFWFQRESAIRANLKAFMVNRVGDFGFILGIGLVLSYAGSLNYGEVFANKEQLMAFFPGTGWLVVSVACICLFVGAMGKSAQFPLHIWLPDSMEGPTPISALIHAATMVTAGIFMVARMSPLFEMSNAALNFVMVIGAITALFMGLVGIVQNDIKRVIAYSTLSQLGYMTAALGASAYSAAIFHLMTHAFYKALLFLAAGSVIIAVHHNQDMRWMGGLRKYMPWTWGTFLAGSLALIGTPFFAGFYSKESIIDAVGASNLPASNLTWIALILSAFVTSVYTFRMFFMTFYGRERYDQDPHAHLDAQGHAPKPKESPWVVTLPLVLLAIPSVVIGAMTLMPMLFGDLFNNVITVDHAAHPAMTALAEKIHGWWAMGLHGFLAVPTWLALAGFLLCYYVYILNPSAAGAIKRMFGPFYTLLDQKFYMDWIANNIFVRGLRMLGTGLWKGVDSGLIDGLFVNGSWKLVGWTASVTRWFQSGYLYHYALVMILGLLGFLTYFLWFTH